MPGRLTLRQLLTHGGVTLVQQGLGTACALAISILLARALGPSGQGQYGLVVSTAVLLTTFCGIGIPAASIYFVGGEKTTAAQAVTQNTLMAGVLGALGATALWASATWLLPGIPVRAVVMGAALVFALLCNNFLTSVLQGAHAFYAYNVAAIAPPLLTLVLLGGFALAGERHVDAALSAALAAQAVTAFATFALFYRRGLPGPWRLDGAYVRRALQYGGLATLANGIGYLNYRADVFLINRWMDTSAVGHYSVAVGVAERLWILSMATSVVLLPHAARSNADGTASLTPIVARHLLWLSVIAGLALAWIAPWAMPLIFGEAYTPSVGALEALLPGIVLCNLGRVLGNDLAGRGRPGLNACLGLATLTVNLSANAWLIPRLGIVGAGWASSLSYGADAIMKVVAFSAVARVSWREAVFPTGDDVALWRRLLSRAPARASE